MNKKRVIALGFFDGVHKGHSALMERCVSLAKEKTLTPCVITFDAHPLNVVRGENIIPLINSAEDRKGLIGRLFGIDDIFFLPFDNELMHMPWQDFAQSLMENYGACHLVCGHDYTFGYKGQGNAEKLAAFCKERGIGCDIVDAVTVEGSRISSTLIREFIAEGDMEKAEEYLGHRHVLTGVVKKGKQLGRTINAPTANLAFEDGVILPKFGVYATKAVLEDGSEWIGVTNVGKRPTVENTDTANAETYLVGFSGDLYGKKLRIEFCRFMRPEMKFSGVGELKDRIAKDTEDICRYFDK